MADPAASAVASAVVSAVPSAVASAVPSAVTKMSPMASAYQKVRKTTSMHKKSPSLYSFLQSY